MIQIIIGDICAIHSDVIVNPSNTRLSGEGGVDRIIHRKAGPALDSACAAIGHCPTGSAVRTDGYQTNARHIIHTAVPRCRPDISLSEHLLASCYASSLELAAALSPKTIAFTAMGAGSMGFSPEQTARIAVRTVWDWWDSRKGRRPEILFVLTDEGIRKCFVRELLLQAVRAFRAACSPARIALSLKHSLPLFFEEKGGLSPLSAEKEAVAKDFRDAFYALQHTYYEYAFLLYQTIGSPDYSQVLSDTIRKDGRSGSPEALFLPLLPQASLEACICFLIYLQRMDYASGGGTYPHLKACVRGDAGRVLDRLEALLTKPGLSGCQPGDTLFFGSYPQQTQSPEPIEWIVLDVAKDSCTLISKYCLDTMGYCGHGPHGENLWQIIPWEHSFLRGWLNGDFFRTAFTPAEQAQILPKLITCGPDSVLTTQSAAQRQDPVHILSASEVFHFFPTREARQAVPTPYARAKGAFRDYDPEQMEYTDFTSWWILPGGDSGAHCPGDPQAVWGQGDIQFHSRNIFHEDFTVRPVICLKRETT